MAKPFYGVDGDLLVEDLPHPHEDIEAILNGTHPGINRQPRVKPGVRLRVSEDAEFCTPHKKGPRSPALKFFRKYMRAGQGERRLGGQISPHRPHAGRDVQPDVAVDKLIRACSVDPPVKCTVARVLGCDPWPSRSTG